MSSTTIGWLLLLVLAVLPADAGLAECVPPYGDEAVRARALFQLQIDRDPGLEQGEVVIVAMPAGERVLANWHKPGERCPRYADPLRLSVGFEKPEDAVELRRQLRKLVSEQRGWRADHWAVPSFRTGRSSLEVRLDSPRSSAARLQRGREGLLLLAALLKASDRTNSGAASLRSAWIEPDYVWPARGPEPAWPALGGLEAATEVTTAAAVPPTAADSPVVVPEPSCGQADWAWWIDAIGAREAWSDGHVGTREVKVAVIDSGIDLDNLELEHAIADNLGINVICADCPPDDDFGHGTKIASVLSAEHDDDNLASGLAPRISLIPVRAADVDDLMTAGNLADAVTEVVKLHRQLMEQDQRIHVVNASLKVQLDHDSDRLASTMQALEAEGILFVTAAGNLEGRDLDIEPLYPASYNFQNMITVGAVDNGGNWRWAKGAETVHLGAPGACVRVVRVEDMDPVTAGGTSVAAAFVSAAAALVYSESLQATAVDVKSRILKSVRLTDAARDRTSSGGVLSLKGLFEPVS